MKYLLIIFAWTFSIFGTVNGQDIPASQVPDAVINSFSNDFSNGRDVEWEKKTGYFEVDFETGWGRDHEARYDEAGSLLYHKEEIRNRELPDIVTDRIRSEYKDYNIDDAERIKEGDVTKYLVTLDSRRLNDLDLLIDDKGEIISEAYDD
ncbi:PepSY-like domain-containing protein [Rhodohalobacter sp.]|uniref:PepSY-like domain-containing protein n=1 Tax=Rhodohalobacter sp. TaxID=1974210 RepID=UPI002ACE09AF|nr:PepSY-like domain-containing protein [Rhodohalobacter sp.]MDZ7754919.1 PepSY-like domain-containing protein [Rhodohalobacter sp.]